jgi:hypothetical protein
MNDPRLDAETAERMLRGDSTGPPELAELLDAASSGLTTERLNGEDAAVAAFRQTRPTPTTRPSTRRLSALFSLKAALTGLLLLLAGGITAATAAQHLPSPLGNNHTHSPHTPKTSTTSQTSKTPRTPTPPQAPSPSTPGNQPTEPTPRATQTEHSPTAHPQKTASPKKHPHPTKKPKDNASKGHKRTALPSQSSYRAP